MMKWIGSALALAAMSLAGFACVGAPTDDSAAAPASNDGDGDEAVDEAADAVVAGCTPSGGCPSGGKTCGAWSAYYACGAPYCTRVDECPGCWGRAANCTNALGQAQNRVRSCTMNSSGQACTDYGYSLSSTCGGGC